ncbi:hypothetical protein [Auraticoccus monumenti]|uniref:Uncharacterized protein n=1 Tax=Auraticoccus monumenti TaxID=675864 RepID=A0A1G6YZ21_9ACTN|nr:hypothetical protein [Auraticoccus monumenti]SDD94895.1 hypothetical protein SAMN04489747_2123 [Auraticoccus monumenti]
MSGATAARVGGPRTSLANGRWTLELRGDEVADIAYDGVLLLRAVRPVVRDRDWNTVPVRVVGPAGGDATATVVGLRFEDGDIGYAGTLTVRLSAHELTVDFEGRAETAFERNRIGLVVLHPASDAGREVVVRHTDGTTTRGRWPVSISPHQPFRNIAGLTWHREQLAAELTLSGDVFENEDQRNWTDASYKTYSTPLDRAFPVPVEIGDTVRQQARLRVADEAAAPRARRRAGDVVTVGDTVVGHLPPLTLGAALHPAPTTPAVPGPGFDGVLVELTDPEERWPELLATAAAQAAALDGGLDVRLVTADPGAVARGVALLEGLPVRRLGVFDPVSHLSTAPLWTALRAAVRETGVRAALLGGTRAHFTELNRGRSELPPDLPALTFSLTPTMHATELPHLLDSLATQRTVVENAVRIAGERPVHVGPVTLARRFNAVATSGRPDAATEARDAVDPLQHTDVAAAWTLGSVRALSVPGVAGLTYYETVGARGVALGGTPGPGGLSPAGRVLAVLATAVGRPILAARTSDDLAALPLAGGGGGTVLLLADLGGRDRQVLVRSAGSEQQVPLAAWAVTRLELG